jgi:hypothetical protein
VDRVTQAVVRGQEGESGVGVGGMWRGRRALQGQGTAAMDAGAWGQRVGVAVPGPSFPQRSGSLVGGHEN